MAFFTIGPPLDQTPAMRQRLIDEDLGPANLDAGPGYQALLTDAGFTSIELVDVTSDYATTLAAWIQARDAAWNELIDVVDEESLDARQSRQRITLAAVRDGLIGRFLVKAVMPP